ncbi:MAG: hypothetical protein VW397_05000, partial [Candidatus Margulisiibacteriota bacterium]
PMGNKTLKFEATLSDAFYQGLETSSAVVNAFHQYTGGYGDVPVYEGIFAVGIDAAYDEWFYNVYLMNLTYFKNPNYNDFWSVYESQFGAIQFESIPLFPTINLGRYLGSEKKGAIGVALGYFTGSLGTYVYVTNQISESLSWGLTGDVGFNFTDHLFSGSSNNDNTNDEGYSYKEYQLVEPKITFGLGYKL